MISAQATILLVFALLATGSTPTDSPRPETLPADGAILFDAPGGVHYDAMTDAWRFSLDEPLTTDKVELPVGHTMRLLPSRGLEIIMAYAGEEKTVRVRLTGMVTRYENLSFLYPLDAEPVSERSIAPSAEPAPAARLVTDPNETSILPSRILEKLRVRRRTDFDRMARTPVLAADRMLVRRTGFFRREGDHWVFELNGFGLGAPTQRFRLLPNEYRQDIERRLPGSFSRPRCTVTAIETTFQGQPYLLLQRVEPAWSHGNFTP